MTSFEFLVWMARTQSGEDADPSGFDVAQGLMQECEEDNVQAQFYGSGYGKCYADKYVACERENQ